jgi:hypothetical protein
VHQQFSSGWVAEPQRSKKRLQKSTAIKTSL